MVLTRAFGRMSLGLFIASLPVWAVDEPEDGALAPLVPVEWTPDGRPIFTHRLEVSGRMIRFAGETPPAEGALAFLSDDVALRTGKVTLSGEQADAVLEELALVTGQEVASTPRVSQALGKAASMWIARELRYPTGWTKNTAAGGGWIASNIETRNDGVGIRADSRLVTDGRIQLTVTVERSEFEGLVEHAEPTAKSTALPGFLASLNAKPGAKQPPVDMGPHAAPFFEPVFSTRTVTAKVRMKSGETVVLRGEGSQGESGAGAANSKSETLLVFITAKAEPLRR